MGAGVWLDGSIKFVDIDNDGLDEIVEDSREVLPDEVFDYFIQVADAKEATIIPNIVVGQLLAYFLTIKKGLDVDKPRNLAKSVTVK